MSMGMIRCPVHGLTNIMTCCVHVGDAVDENRYEHAQVVIDRSGSHHALCDRCLAQALPQLQAPLEDPLEDGYLALDPSVVPYCDQDVKEWYAATGQGDLSQAISRARVERNR